MRGPSRQAMQAHIGGVDGLLCLLTDRIDGEMMDAAGPGLKVISSFSVGIDNVDVAAASAHGIAVGNTPGVLTDATADLAFALLLAAGRRVLEGERLVKSGGWKTWGPSFMLGADLAGTKLGIVGFGRIGRAVARRAVLAVDLERAAAATPAEITNVPAHSVLEVLVTSQRTEVNGSARP